MKPSIIICFMLTAISYCLSAQVAISDALLNNSEMVKYKQRFSFTNKDLHKSSFGPFTTVDIHSGRQHLIGREKESYFEIKGKSISTKTAMSKIKTQPFALTIIQDGGDSIISNVDLISVQGGDHALVEMTSGKALENEAIKFYCASMTIQIRSDSLDWHMEQKNGKYDADYDDYPLLFDRILTNGVDNIFAKGAEAFPVTRKLFGNTTKGIVFIYNKKQVAALQTYPETFIWFSKDIKEPHKQVIAASIISLLSINPNKNAY